MLYQMIESSGLSEEKLIINREAIAVIDLNGDFRRDIIITNSGDPSKPISESDPSITILFATEDGRFILADTTSLAPTGWINDYIFLDSNNNGFLEIVAIDHGREIAYDAQYWEKMPVYEYRPADNKFIELTDLTIGNERGFYHNSANSADIDNDGLNDFIVAKMGPNNFDIYKGSRDFILSKATEQILGNKFTEITTWNSSSYVDAGAAGAFDYGGDGDYDLIILPYTDTWTSNQNYAQIFEFEDGIFINSSFQDIRKSVNLPSDWGYSYFRVEDINSDGLHDIVAFAENPNNNAGGTAVFISLIQKFDGSFDVSPAFPAENLITERRGELFVGNIWQDYKFSLEDLDGDNDLDLYWGQWFGGKEDYFKDGIFINDGTGHFYRDTLAGNQIGSQISWHGNSGARTYMSDLNYDGIGDFIVFDQNWDSESHTTIKVFYSQKTGNFGPITIVIGGLREQYSIVNKGRLTEVRDELLVDGVLQVELGERLIFQNLAIAFDIAGHAGSTAKLLGATFGKESLANKALVGIALSYMDAGTSYSALMELAINAVLGSGASNAAAVDLLYTNVVGVAPSVNDLAFFTDWLDKGIYTKASFGVLAADTELNIVNVGLVGLASTGLEYTPYVA